jgi:hypothetical protein
VNAQATVSGVVNGKFIFHINSSVHA